MTETRTPYAAGQQQPEPADLPAIEARLAAATPGPWRIEQQRIRAAPEITSTLGIRRPIARVLYFGGSEDRKVDHNATLIAHAPADLRALVAEVRRLQALLETEQRAKWAAKQDKQYWQEEAERLRLQVAQLAESLEVATGITREDK